MNIFEPEDIDLIDSRLCKIKYLAHENKWIALQYQNFNNLILKYKDLIELLSHHEDKNPQEYITKLHLLNQTIKKYIKLSAASSLSSDEIIRDDLQFNQIQFVKLIISFQQKIQQVRTLTFQSQEKLQKLQAQKGLSQIHVQQNSSKIQPTSAIKSIESYDIYPRVVEKYKKMIMQMKLQKNSLQIQLKTIEQQSKKQIESTCSTVESQYTRKNLENISSEFQIDLLSSTKKQQMSVFEKAVLVYKKKKFTNQKLREKIMNLRRNLQQKQRKFSLIKQVNDNKVWNQLSNLENEQHDFYVESSVNEFSTINKTCENLEFDIDISNIVKPQKLKTLFHERRKDNRFNQRKEGGTQVGSQEFDRQNRITV